jgi:hypothetical protein
MAALKFRTEATEVSRLAEEGITRIVFKGE